MAQYNRIKLYSIIFAYDLYMNINETKIQLITNIIFEKRHRMINCIQFIRLRSAMYNYTKK